MSNASETFVPPDLYQTLLTFRTNIFNTLRCSMPASITLFDSGTGLAVVQPLIQRILPDGSAAAFQPLLDVPVFTLQGGGCEFQTPITPGDQCLLVFCDRDTATWLRTGSQAPPPSIRAHDLSDAFAFIGFNPLNSAGVPVSSTEIRMVTPGALARVAIDKNTNLVTIQNASSSLLLLLQNLCTILEAATIDLTHGTFQPATIAALQAFALTLQELLY